MIFGSCIDFNRALVSTFLQENASWGEMSLLESFPQEFNDTLFPFGLDVNVPHLKTYTVLGFKQLLAYYGLAQNILVLIGVYGITMSLLALLSKALPKLSTNRSFNQRTDSAKLKKKQRIKLQDKLLILSLLATVANLVYWLQIGFVCRNSTNVASFAYALCVATSYHVAILWLRVVFSSAKHKLEIQGKHIKGFKLKDISKQMFRYAVVLGYSALLASCIVRVINLFSNDVWWSVYARVIQACSLAGVLTIFMIEFAYVMFGRSSLQSLHENRVALEATSRYGEHAVSLQQLEQQVKGVVAYNFLGSLTVIGMLLMQVFWEVIRDQMNWRFYIFAYFSVLFYVQSIGTTLTELMKMMKKRQAVQSSAIQSSRRMSSSRGSTVACGTSAHGRHRDSSVRLSSSVLSSS